MFPGRTARGLLSPAQNGWMPSPLPSNLRPTRLARSRRVLLLPLELLLAEMQARELVICGLATDMCVQLTAMDAFLREFKAWVPADCTAAESAQAKAASLAYMSTILKCDVSLSASPPRKTARKTRS